MTLIDSRPGIAATYRALAEATGIAIDVDLAVGRLGLPLRWEIAHWFAPDEVDRAVAYFRELYPAYAIDPSRPLPGAMQALRAVHRAGGRVLVVTAKQERLARMHIEHLQMRVELVVGDQFAEGKAAALSRHRAVGYVGDHRADMLAARAAGVPGIGVTTGPCTREELLEAGAQTVLGTLADFPAWISVSALSRGD